MMKLVKSSDFSKERLTKSDSDEESYKRVLNLYIENQDENLKFIKQGFIFIRKKIIAS